MHTAWFLAGWELGWVYRNLTIDSVGSLGIDSKMQGSYTNVFFHKKKSPPPPCPPAPLPQIYVTTAMLLSNGHAYVQRANIDQASMEMPGYIKGVWSNDS